MGTTSGIVISGTVVGGMVVVGGMAVVGGMVVAGMTTGFVIIKIRVIVLRFNTGNVVVVHIVYPYPVEITRTCDGHVQVYDIEPFRILLPRTWTDCDGFENTRRMIF
jgi:hypothetical protein